MNALKKFIAAFSSCVVAFSASAQKYSNGLVDKTIAVVGNEMIMLSDIEEEVNGLVTYDRRIIKVKEKGEK